MSTPIPTLDAFTHAYLHAAAFTEDPDPGSGEYPMPDLSAFDRGFIDHAIAECARFQSAHQDLISDDVEQAGRDFWYTRNGHGCGFWDGDWPEPAATILSDAAQAFGEVYDYPFRNMDRYRRD
jgi:hypothetical protein